MSKPILIFSDLHIHSHKKSHDRLEDCIKVLEWTFKTAVDRQIQDVVFLGDLFHDRTRIEILTLFRVYEVFERYFEKPKFRLHLLLGNHDLWHRESREIHSPIFLKAFPNIQIIDRPSTISIQDTPVDFLPFTENPLEDLRQFERRSPIMCSHMAIDGAKLNSFGSTADVIVEHDGEMVKVDSEFLHAWDRVFLGHYHKWQFLDDRKRFEYVGSPLQLSFSETEQQKHLIQFDLETFETEYIINNFSPKHLIIHSDEIHRHDLEKNFVIIKVDAVATSELLDLRKEISEKHQAASLEFRPEARKSSIQEQTSIIEDAKNIIQDHDTMLDRYVAEFGPASKLDSEKLIRIGKEICQSDRWML